MIGQLSYFRNIYQKQRLMLQKSAPKDKESNQILSNFAQKYFSLPYDRWQKPLMSCLCLTLCVERREHRILMIQPDKFQHTKSFCELTVLLFVTDSMVLFQPSKQCLQIVLDLGLFIYKSSKL